MSMLTMAIALATHAHDDQVDKAGEPYILHPLGAMLRMKTETERITAVLHDVIEDTYITLEFLAAKGYPPEILDALDHLTRRDGETYDAFIDRVAENDLARRVKMADLEDNLSPARLGKKPTNEEKQRRARYFNAHGRLDRAGGSM